MDGINRGVVFGLHVMALAKRTESALTRPVPARPLQAPMPIAKTTGHPTLRRFERPLHAGFTLKGVDPSKEEMIRIVKISAKYGDIGENKGLVNDLEKGNYLRTNSYLPISNVHKMLFSHLMESHVTACLNEASSNGEPVKALVIGAEKGQDAFDLAHKLRVRVPQGSQVLANDKDPNAIKLIEMTKENETSRLREELQEDASLENSNQRSIGANARSLKQKHDWLHALQTVVPMEGDIFQLMKNGTLKDELHFVTSAFTFSYISNLDELIPMVSSAMRKHGVLAFQIYGETHQTLDKPLVCYSATAMQAMLEESGFEVVLSNNQNNAKEAFHNIYICAVKK